MGLAEMAAGSVLSGEPRLTEEEQKNLKMLDTRVAEAEMRLKQEESQKTDPRRKPPRHLGPSPYETPNPHLYRYKPEELQAIEARMVDSILTRLLASLKPEIERVVADLVTWNRAYHTSEERINDLQNQLREVDEGDKLADEEIVQLKEKIAELEACVDGVPTTHLITRLWGRPFKRPIRRPDFHEYLQRGGDPVELLAVVLSNVEAKHFREQVAYSHKKYLEAAERVTRDLQERPLNA